MYALSWFIVAAMLGLAVLLAIAISVVVGLLVGDRGSAPETRADELPYG